MDERQKLPPHDLDAEEATIGSLLIDGGAMEKIPFLTYTDFYGEANQLIFKACMEVYDRGEGINQITVAQELDRQGKLEVSGGAAFLSHVISIVPTSLDIVNYANIVQRLSVSRQMITAGGGIATLGYMADPDPSSALNKADEMLLSIRRNTVGTPIISPEDRVKLLSDRYDRLFAKEQEVAVKTGIASLDYMLGGGLFQGEVILLAGRTGMGKTAFLETITNNVGKTGKNVLYCSVEMDWESLSDRDMAGLMGVPISAIRLGGYEGELYARMTGEGLEAIGNLSVFYYDDNPITTAKVMNAGMEMKLRRGLSLIVVDYLGIMGDEYGRSPYERVGYISRRVKQIARVLDVPVLVAHQLSRGLESRDDKRPQLHDLRDSGNLEEDADVVLFLYRENYYDEATEEKTTEVLMGKQRQGDSGEHKRVRLMFDSKGKCYRGIQGDR